MTESTLPAAAAAQLREWERRFADREPAVHAFVPEPGRGLRLRRELAELASRLAGVEPESAAGQLPLAWTWLGVKDIFRVASLPTRAGSRLPEEALRTLRGPDEEVPLEEAPCVSALRRAGAVVAGKTVTTEFAYFAPGPTRNPVALEHTPGGSSSGSAAAVGAGLCDLALGTQTIGSIGRPASFCGVVGFKPSYDRISRRGVIPLAPSLDHVGVFARRVRDVREACRVLLRPDEWPAPSDRRPRCAVPRGPYLDHFLNPDSGATVRSSDDGPAHFAGCRARLEAAGFDVVEIDALPDFADLATRHRLLVAAEAAAVHADLFPRYETLYAPQTAELIRRGERAPAAQVEQARRGRLELRQELTAAMDEHAVDLWISPPALGSAPRGLDSTGDPVMNLPWTHAGMPALVVAAGPTAAGLPMGLQLVARFGADEALLDWGAQIEATLGVSRGADAGADAAPPGALGPPGENES